jgi:serine/threonine protein kinase
VLGDFGLADFHRTHSRSNEDPGNVARSPKYRAPEFDIETKISRKIDIWMLGCTFLEFVTWFLMGLDAVLEQFPKDRSEPDINGIYADIFFRIVTEGHRVVSVVKPQVTA